MTPATIDEALRELATATVIQPLDLRLRLALIHLDAEAAPPADPALPVDESTGELFQGGAQ